MKKICLLLLIQFSLLAVKAQDIIVMKDKSEIKSKVFEITNDKIKYYKWEMKDGPIYNIDKKDVFMILYQNGHRELITAEEVKKTVTVPVSAFNTNTEKKQVLPPPSKIDTTVDWLNTKIKYSPSRVTLGLTTFNPLSASIDQEIRIRKNVLNAGLSISYLFVANNTPSIFVYASGYLPVNRMSKKYEDQDKGLFVYVHVGLSAASVLVPKINYQTGNSTYETEIITGFGWYIGADYFFTKGLGLAVKTNRFKSFAAGIVTSF